MRRLSGTYDGTEYALQEYDNGVIECPSNLRETLVDAQGRMPRGEALEDALRVLFGESLQVKEYA